MRRTVTAALAATGLLLASVMPANAGLSEDNVGEWEVLDTTYEDPSNPEWTPGAVQTESDLSEILGPNEALLTWENVEGKNELGTSIEEPNLDLSLDDPFSAYFCYTLEDGATESGGAPRLFVEVDGTYYNTWDDGNPDGLDSCGEYEAWGWLDLPAGTVGHVGLVYDNGVEGSVVVSNPTIANIGVLFEGEDSDVDPEITSAPSAVIAGEEVSISADGFLAGEDVAGVLNSDPVDLGVQTADDEGAVSFTFTVPSEIMPGTHTVTLTGQESERVASVSFDVAAPSADPGDKDSTDDGSTDEDESDAPQGYNPGLSSNTGHGSTNAAAAWAAAGSLATAVSLVTALLGHRLVTSRSQY